MKKYLSVLAVLCGLLFFAGPSLATINTAGDGFEDRTNGTIYDYYQNSGALLFTQQGNDNIITDVQASLNAISGYDNIVLQLASNVAFTPYNNDNWSGTWAVSTPVNGTIDFYTVKAGNYWAMYLVDPASNTGTWSTYDIWAIGGSGTGGHPTNGMGGVAISHFTGYNPSVSVPEPSILLLLGAGLVAVGIRARRKA